MDITWLMAGTGTTYLKLRRQYSNVGSTYLPNKADNNGRRSATSSFSIQLSTACSNKYEVRPFCYICSPAACARAVGLKLMGSHYMQWLILCTQTDRCSGQT